jgi:hypothetical protein
VAPPPGAPCCALASLGLATHGSPNGDSPNPIPPLTVSVATCRINLSVRSVSTYRKHFNLAFKAQVYGSAYLNKLGGVTYTNGVQVLLQ